MGHALALPVSMDLTAKGRLFTDVFEVSSDPLALVDVNGRLREVNGAMERITGIAREQLVGSMLADCFSQPRFLRQRRVHRVSFGLHRLHEAIDKALPAAKRPRRPISYRIFGP